MKTYKLPTGGKVRTNAKRRYLVVGHYVSMASGGPSARPSVETTTDSVTDAERLTRGYVRQYPHTQWFFIDQTNGDIYDCNHNRKPGQ